MFEGDAAKKVGAAGNYTSYLDVSQYILKEYSPMIKPSSPQHEQDCASQESLELEPIELDHSQITLTPVTKGLIRQEVQDILDDFILEDEDLGELQEHGGPVRRRGDKKRYSRSNGLELFRFQCDLDKIIEYEDQQSYVSGLDSEHSYSEEIQEDEHCYVNSNTFHTVWPLRDRLKSKISLDLEEENKTTVDVSVVDYSENIERFGRNPRIQILKRIREIQCGVDGSEEEKKLLIKKHLEEYLLQAELFCFQHAWQEISSTLKNTVAAVKLGLQRAFNRKVGPISYECRRVKLLKYLEKKKRRIWRKKVSYDCRKKVADGRLRIKGKFVTREQACEQLGLDSLDNFSAQEIKEMLQQKMQERLQLLMC